MVSARQVTQDTLHMNVNNSPAFSGRNWSGAQLRSDSTTTHGHGTIILIDNTVLSLGDCLDSAS